MRTKVCSVSLVSTVFVSFALNLLYLSKTGPGCFLFCWLSYVLKENLASNLCEQVILKHCDCRRTDGPLTLFCVSLNVISCAFLKILYSLICASSNVF